MTKRILLIDHPFGRREDRAQAHLAERGHALTWCCPGRDEALPDHRGHDALIVYGGPEMLSTDLDRSETAYLRREADFIERRLTRLGAFPLRQLFAALHRPDDLIARMRQVPRLNSSQFRQLPGMLRRPAGDLHQQIVAHHSASRPVSPARFLLPPDGEFAKDGQGTPVEALRAPSEY